MKFPGRVFSHGCEGSLVTEDGESQAGLSVNERWDEAKVINDGANSQGLP